MSDLARLVVILGPTASGKSALAIELAEKFGGEVLVCDSTQVYRHFDIGTAKVSLAERRNIPHHLLDLVEPGEVFTAGEYRRRALACLDGLRHRGKLPILTAGTGLYLRALLEGLAEAPARSEELRERLRRQSAKQGPAYLHRLLARLDPLTGLRIAPRDTQKIIRALELRILTGKRVSEIHRAGRTTLQGYKVTKIGLQPPRDALYARINERVYTMIRAGWLEEVRTLMMAGLRGDEKPFQFIGYSELRQQIEKNVIEETAAKRIQQATRQFAKRQITWFRREAGVAWLNGFGHEPDVIAAAIALAQTDS